MPVAVEGDAPPLCRMVAEAAQGALGACGWGDAELSIVLCDDAGMRPLNAEWRGKDASTDVLSFPQLAFEQPGVTAEGALLEGAPLILGDVVISVETARRQAAALGHTLEQELQVLLAHGIAHLLGHTHEDTDDSAAMAAIEDVALDAMGLSMAGLVRRVCDSGDPPR